METTKKRRGGPIADISSQKSKIIKSSINSAEDEIKKNNSFLKFWLINSVKWIIVPFIFCILAFFIPFLIIGYPDRKFQRSISVESVHNSKDSISIFDLRDKNIFVHPKPLARDRNVHGIESFAWNPLSDSVYGVNGKGDLIELIQEGDDIAEFPFSSSMILHVGPVLGLRFVLVEANSVGWTETLLGCHRERGIIEIKIDKIMEEDKNGDLNPAVQLVTSSFLLNTVDGRKLSVCNSLAFYYTGLEEAPVASLSDQIDSLIIIGTDSSSRSFSLLLLSTLEAKQDGRIFSYHYGAHRRARLDQKNNYVPGSSFAKTLMPMAFPNGIEFVKINEKNNLNFIVASTTNRKLILLEISAEDGSLISSSDIFKSYLFFDNIQKYPPVLPAVTNPELQSVVSSSAKYLFSKNSSKFEILSVGLAGWCSSLEAKWLWERTWIRKFLVQTFGLAAVKSFLKNRFYSEGAVAFFDAQTFELIKIFKKKESDKEGSPMTSVSEGFIIPSFGPEYNWSVLIGTYQTDRVNSHFSFLSEFDNYYFYENESESAEDEEL